MLGNEICCTVSCLYLLPVPDVDCIIYPFVTILSNVSCFIKLTTLITVWSDLWACSINIDNILYACQNVLWMIILYAVKYFMWFV